MSPEVLAEFRRLWAEGASIKRIARATGYSTNTIMAWAMNHRDEFPYRYRRVPKELRMRYVQLIADGDIGTAQAAEMLGVSNETVRRWVRLAKRSHQRRF